jgi:D-amino-acid dehydrogenase
MLGISLGPATGQVVSEIATGAQSSFDLRPFSAERFN